MIRGLILDLDGTVYLGRAEVSGAAAFVARARAADIRCLFVTNRANRPPAEICTHLAEHAIDAGPADVLTSAEATAGLLPPGRAFVIGEDGIRTALEQAGFTLADRDVAYVIVSFDRDFGFAKLRIACRLIDAGARFVATNPDRAIRLEDGLSPGTGAIIAAVNAVTGAAPLVVGKPQPHIVASALGRLGLPREAVLMVGDNLETDIPAGARAGVRTALILTGISRRTDLAGAEYQPTWVVEDFAELWRVLEQSEGAA